MELIIRMNKLKDEVSEYEKQIMLKYFLKNFVLYTGMYISTLHICLSCFICFVPTIYVGFL